MLQFTNDERVAKMKPVLDVDGDDIGSMTDDGLRELVCRLCRAEVVSRGLSTVGVTCGGHQDAPDGGVDVRVQIESNLHSYIPRGNTVFQVKQSAFRPADIKKEMCPGGALRPAIRELHAQGGAYIIVAGKDSVTDSALKKRIDAMENCLGEHRDIVTDFYDGERIAAWINARPPLALWVKEKIGAPVQGWQPFGNWSNPGGNEDEDYLPDEKNCNIFAGDGKLTPVEGINKIRNALAKGGASVRLVGLSGVGKTRLVQALFDERVGENALDKHRGVYTNEGDEPEPVPASFARQLVARGTPCFLVVDNCSQEIHSRLVNHIKGSAISLVTVEYDIREDLPESTDVFRMEPCSAELVEKFIENRYPHIGYINRKTITDLSGGNPRLAVAIANSIKKGDVLENNDNELFRRLFEQRHGSSEHLLKSAEVCSLVYSFDFDGEKNVRDEMELLAGLTTVGAVDSLHRDVAEIQRRELVQQRGRWRAVLPHAIANKLAVRALENIPVSNILGAFTDHQRLLKSFSRRLSYLHNSKEARQIAGKWLAEDGMFSDVSVLNESEWKREIFENIAPVDTIATLAVIERIKNKFGFACLSYAAHSTIFNLLKDLAYDENLFDKCVGLLCQLTMAKRNESDWRISRNGGDDIARLFQPFLSGTRAFPEQRLGVIKKLANSTMSVERRLSADFLGAALRIPRHCSGLGGSNFGARPRDLGFWPGATKEFRHWYNLFINYALHLATSDGDLSSDARKLLSEDFRGLWTHTGTMDTLENVADKILQQGFWAEGLAAVQSIINFDGEKMPDDELSRLHMLKEKLQPSTLIDKVYFYIVSPVHCFNLVDDDKTKPHSHVRTSEMARSLGAEVASDENVLQKLLPDIFNRANHGEGRLFDFGVGLGSECKFPKIMWNNFRKQLSVMDTKRAEDLVMRGFISALSQRDAALCDSILDEMVTNEVLAEFYPSVQFCANIADKDVKRLKKAVTLGLSPVANFMGIAYGRRHENISDQDLSELLQLIASKFGGARVVIEIMGMRAHYYRESKKTPGDDIVACGRSIIAAIDFSVKEDTDHELATITNMCFAGQAAESDAKSLCKKLLRHLSDNWSSCYDRTLSSVAARQPLAFLDEFFGENTPVYLHYKFGMPLSEVDDDTIIGWCEQQPDERYIKIADSIRPYTRTAEQPPQWTPLAMKILENKPDKAVVDKLICHLSPRMWSGSRAELMQKNAPLISELKAHKNELIARLATDAEREFAREIESWREREKRMNERESRENRGFE